MDGSQRLEHAHAKYGARRSGHANDETPHLHPLHTCASTHINLIP
jgi:hypothetical protein